MNPIRMRGVAVVGVAVVVAVVLAACGGSSSSTSSSTSASSTNAAAAAVGGTGATARRSALATCLKKYGVTLPAGGFGGRRFGATGASGRFFGPTGRSGRFGASGGFGPTGRSGAPGGRGFFGGAGGGFAGNSKFATALAKCGGGFGGRFGGRFGASGASGPRAGFSASSAQDRAEVTSFIACMKTNGVSLPTPNFSGTGSVFGTKVSTTSPKFIAAYAKCKSVLKFLSVAPGAGGAAPAA